MLIFKIIFLCLLSLLGQPAFALENNDILPPKEAFRLSGIATANNKVEITWAIAEGYMVYANSLGFESQTDYIQLDVLALPEGKVKHDELLGDVVHYRNALKINITLLDVFDAQSVRILVRYQGCSDKGVCYPPQKETLDIALPPKNQPVKTESINPLQQLVKKIPALSFNAGQAELLPPEQAFQFFASVKDVNTLHVNWKIAEGYYLYREKVQLELINTEGAQLGIYSIPRGTPKYDESFGQVEIIHDELAFDVPIKRSGASAQNIILKAGYQGCADRGVCYPPMTKEISLELTAGQATAPINNDKAAPALSEQDQIVKALHQDSLWATLLSFFGFGFLLSLTPCIFPMIPILSGIIVGHHNHKTTTRAFLLSLSYVVASALTYTVFGILAALFGGNLQTTFQQPWIVALFSAIFVLLSLSMFGFYNLDLPNSIKTKLHNSSVRHQDGSLWGAAIMGSLSSLIVGPCVAAPLAGALIYIGQTGNALLGGSALFAMGMGMGVPLLLLGASAGKLLPKAGDWLNSTKAVFGVVMLGVAVWMLSRIIPPAVTIMLWSALLIVPAIYLSAIDPLPLHSSGWRKLWKGVGLMMLAYGLVLLIGFSMGNTNPLKPLHGLAGNNVVAKEQGIAFERVSSLQELEARIQQAGANNQMVMLDFYADWCISCKEMEAYTFSDSRVKQALAGFVLLQADVTKNSEDDKALLAKFNLIGPPGVLFFDADGLEQAEHRVIGYQDAQTFIKTLQEVRL
ncbi:MAG: protein-disulfide reductase DsbD [Methylococcaceae bacterium]